MLQLVSSIISQRSAPALFLGCSVVENFTIPPFLLSLRGILKMLCITIAVPLLGYSSLVQFSKHSLLVQVNLFSPFMFGLTV